MGIIIGIILVWSVIGGWLCWVWSQNANSTSGTKGWELCNPYWYYQYFQVNGLGAVMLSLVYNLLCPIGAVIYWFYKLCTIGRK